MTPVKISENDIQKMIIKGVQDVFSTMLKEPIEFKETVVYPSDEQGASKTPPSSPIPPDASIVAGSVGFIGVVNGVTYLYMKEDTAKLLTSKFLGMTLDEIDGPETVNDTIGEIANMTVGAFKNQLCDIGYNCRLTIPSILRGANITAEATFSSKVIRTSYRFEIAKSIPFVVDILMKKIT